MHTGKHPQSSGQEVLEGICTTPLCHSQPCAFLPVSLSLSPDLPPRDCNGVLTGSCEASPCPEPGRQVTGLGVVVT